jgi:hypothetical protein
MPRKISAVLVFTFLLYGFGVHTVQIAAMPAKAHILYGNVFVCSETSTTSNIEYIQLKRDDTQYTIFTRIGGQVNPVMDSCKMGSLGDQYGLIVLMSIRDREPGTAQTGDTAHIYIDADDDPDNGNEVPITEAYLEPGHQPVQLPYIVGEPGAYVMLDIYLSPLKLLKPAVSYDIPNTTLILEFNRPVRPDMIIFDGIGMEVDDSGNWDFQMSDVRELHANETEPSHEITVDINRDHPTTVNLALAGLVTHQPVDLLLQAGAFTDSSGGNTPGSRIAAVSGPDDIRIQMIADGFVLGTAGDVSGNGEVTAYDAALILRSTIDGQTVFPTYRAALDISEQLASYGYSYDVMVGMADVDGSGGISSHDASLVLGKAAGLTDNAPISNSSQKRCRLNVNNYDGQKLDVSIDLDDVSGVYSADIVMVYNPQALTVADVSGTPSISGWLFEQGTTDPGNLRISLAGACQPAAGGSLVTVSFDMGGRTQGSPLRDAIKQLDIIELKLNGGRLRTTVENLPRAFALLQNYPNPFNPETWIPYRLSEPTDVTITIYNVNGQMVRRLDLGTRMPGHYIDRAKAACWDGKNEAGEEVSSGIYFYQLRAGRDASVRKMIVAR